MLLSPRSSAYQPSLHEKCAVFGVYSRDLPASQLAYYGLHALQHRGQEATGIVSSDGQQMRVHKGSGLVTQVYDEEDLQVLSGGLAIGHNRYSTSKGASKLHTQPVLPGNGQEVTVAHNGNLPDTSALENFLAIHDIDPSNFNDSELMAEAIHYQLRQGHSLTEAIRKCYPLFTGAFSLLVMTKNELAALRDPYGIRPLSIGTLEGGYIFASETCALDAVGADFWRDVRPGELVVASNNDINSHQLVPGRQKLDIFEFIYFARPDSTLLGKSVDKVRHNLGRQLARECPIEADLVIPIPDSAIPAAMGYAEQAGLPFYHGLVKNRYIGRTFIQPEQKMRSKSVHMKLNALPHALEGKRVVVVDDSVVRGTTSPSIVAMLYKAGAKEVHFLVSSPPYLYPDFYGIDTPIQNKLLAYGKTSSEILNFIGSDSLYYLSYEGMIAATGLSEDLFCTSCFTGEYPLDLGIRQLEVHPTFEAVEDIYLPTPLLELEPILTLS